MGIESGGQPWRVYETVKRVRDEFENYDPDAPIDPAAEQPGRPVLTPRFADTLREAVGEIADTDRVDSFLPRLTDFLAQHPRQRHSLRMLFPALSERVTTVGELREALKTNLLSRKGQHRLGLRGALFINRVINPPVPPR